ncbi:MAG: serine--tRNA ligase, partial [Candidatus Woesearchaeota archaeon]|nr:serine--tRNA ligase [Candidatus Woesearchaeota archaeon]
MLDIKFIRENPDVVKKNLKKKFQDEKIKTVDALLKLDKEYSKILNQSQVIRTKRNKISEEINALKKDGKDIKTKVKQAKEIPKKLEKVEAKRLEVFEKLRQGLLTIPNIIHDSVPIGKDDTENKEIEKIGKPRKFDFKVQSHVDVLEKLGIVDFDAARRVSGNGFFYLKGNLALLNQALLRFGIDFMLKKGFVLVEPPLMINKATTEGVVDFGFFKDMTYKIEEEDLYLIGTSEHPLIGMVSGKVLEESDLPIKMVGVSQCFRKEIGSHGIDE